jgi:hypothetical protein
MRGATRRVTVSLAAAGAVIAAAASGIAGGGPGCDDRFVVHEWGTFTSMAGGNGIALEGLSREEESLPSFVYSRSEVRDCPLRAKGWKGLEVPAEHVTQKMETPVLYFHSREARRVRVRVDFIKGLISQWYPVSDLLGPPEHARDAGPLDVSKVERSFLQWDVDVLPRGADTPAEMPAAAKDDPWTFARDVDANWIRTLPRKAPERSGPVEAERYLFYRGLGAFRLPLTVVAERGGRFRLRNEGDVAVQPAFVLQVDGRRGQIVETPQVAPHGEESVALHGGEWWGPIDEVVEKLRVWVADRLTKQGLAADEARAMVRTWSRSWFGSEGTRLIWFVPRGQVDALLPLSIDPKPDEVVRVLVGRMELIPPETADEVEAALRDVRSGEAATAAAAKARLDRLGRFLEPHLRNVLSRTEDEAVRGRATAMLAELATAGDAR